MSTLYRKYRPQTFEEVVGQNHIKLTLKNEIESGRVAHAYLFCGPRAVGKTTLARVFAKSINCQNRKEGSSEPCNECQSCKDIVAGRNMDIIEIDAASNTGVDNVRENIIASSRMAPSSSKYKVFIIDEVHMLSTASFNALLKTMEEPPAYMVFILCTTEIHKVPSTIISRCQRFDFRKISIIDVVKKLKYIAVMEKMNISDEVLESIARQSQGYMRDAESLFGQVLSVAGHIEKNGGITIDTEEASLVIPRSDLNEALELLNLLSKRDSANAIALVNRLINEGVDLKIFISDFIEFSRKIMLNKISQNLADKFGLDFGDAMEKKAMEVGKDLPIERMVTIIESFMLAIQQIKNSFIIQLPVELAIVKLCHMTDVVSVRQVVAPVAKTVSVNPVANDVAQNNNTDPININNDSIKNRWSDFLIRIKQYNHSLSFIMKVCEPQEIKGNQLCLAFKYKFHKDRVDDPQIKELIEKALYETYSAQILVSAVVDEKIEDGSAIATAPIVEEKNNNIAEEGKPSDTMNDLLNVFGGKILN